MFTLNTGTYRSLEPSFVDDVLKLKKAQPLSSALIVSPSRQILDHLQRLIAHRSPGLINLHFQTFYDLAERLLSESAFQETQITESAFFKEMIRRVLSGESGEAIDLEIQKLFGLTNRPISKGLPAALAGTLKDLRDSGIRAKAALHADKEGYLYNEAPVETATLALHARMVGLFQQKKLRTSADLLRRAAELIPAHPWIKQQQAIYLYGFYDLTGVQLDFVRALGDHPNAHVYFPYEEDNPAYAFAERLLKDPALTGKVSVTIPSPLAGEGRVRGKASIESWSCSGSRDEVWLAAKEILKLIDDGMPFEAIGVVSRNLAPYLPALREIFAAHQIPFSATRGEPAGSHPLVKTIWTLMALDETQANAKTLKRDLEKSPYITPTLTQTLSLKGEPACRQAGVAKPGEGETWSHHIAWATQLIKSAIELPKDATGEESSLLDGILETLQDLNVLDLLGHTVSQVYFLEAFREKLDELERPGPARAHAGVRVMEVQQARGLPFRALFILGMNEKVFPRLIREDPFLSDAARSALAQATGARLGRKMNGYEEERLLFALMSAAAGERLYLLSQRSDEEGKTMIPSVYLQELKRIDPALEPKRLPRSMAEKFTGRSPLTWTPKELSVLINRARLDPKELYMALKWDVPGFYRLLSTHRALETMKPGIGSHDGLIETPELLKSVLQKGFSPSALEDLADCPFQYYAGQVLRISPQEDLAPGGEMTLKALGTLFHRTLEIFYTGCREKGLPVGKVDLESRITDAASASFEEFAERLSAIYPVANKSSKLFVINNLIAFLERDLAELKDTGFRPQWFEQPLDGTIPQLKLPASVTFRGKPDRMDLREEAGTAEIRVVDYKSGKPKSWTGKVETQLIKGKFLQLPIYLGLAGAFAEKNLNRQVQATEATLRPIREGDEESNPKTLTRTFWDSPAAKIFAENMRELIGIIEQGHFYIEPSADGEHGYCSRCDFARICRKEHMPTRKRAENDALRIRVEEKLGRTAPKDEAHSTVIPRGSKRGSQDGSPAKGRRG